MTTDRPPGGGEQRQQRAPRHVDPHVLDDLLSMVDEVLRPRDPRQAPAASDFTTRILEAQMDAYEALGRLGALLKDACGVPSVMHPSAPDQLPELWMEWLRDAMHALVESTWRMGQAMRSREGEDTEV